MSVTAANIALGRGGHVEHDVLIGVVGIGR